MPRRREKRKDEAVSARPINRVINGPANGDLAPVQAPAQRRAS